MQTSFPTDTGFSGLYLNGYRRHLSSASEQLVGTVVVKRNYQINGSQLTAIDDPDGIRLADLQQEVSYNGETQAISIYEHDVALYKPLADLVVRDNYTVGHSYRLNVQANGGSDQTWFSRTIASPQPLPPDADAQENIFGWQPRFEGVRFAQGSVPETFPNPAPDTPDMSGFNNLFFNGYRRDFAQPGFPQSEFQAGDNISMTRTLLGETDSDTLFSFVLGQESIQANLYLYSGRGPDEERYWCVERPIDFRLDTVVVTPSQDNAYLVWRGVWDYAQFPANNYRKLDVIAQGVSHG